MQIRRFAKGALEGEVGCSPTKREDGIKPEDLAFPNVPKN